MNKPHDWLAIAVAICSLVVQMGSLVWWGGKIDARMASSENRIDKLEQAAGRISDRNAQQDVNLGVQQQQNNETNRRLTAIENKLDQAIRK